jgi:curved DNA-binding protein CbpA
MIRPDALAALNLPETATLEEIEQAYRRLARRYPPEFHPEKFRQIDEAYRFLSSLPNRLEQLLAPPKYQTSTSAGKFPYPLESPDFTPQELLAAFQKQLLSSQIWGPNPDPPAKPRPSAKSKTPPKPE